MNEVLSTIEKRYSCRNFTGEKLEKGQIEAIAKAAVQAPSGMNVQPWQVFVITNEELLKELDDAGMAALKALPDQSAYDRMMQRGGKIYYNAPAMFLIVAPEGNDMDCGILSQNIALAATSMGLGNCICGLARLSFMGEKGKAFFDRIGVPEGCDFAMSVLVGKAGQEGTPHAPDMTKIHYVD